MPIWLPTTKSQKTPKFPCVQVACDIPLESSRQGLQQFFRPHLNRRYAHKVMGPQSCGSPNFGPPLGSPRTKWHLGVGLMARHKVYYKGEGGGFPQVRVVVNLWVCVCPWFVHAPKCFNYALTNLWFRLCRSMWVIELLVNLPNPIWELQHALLPLKCYELGNVPQLLFLHCLRLWIHSRIHQGAWGCVRGHCQNDLAPKWDWIWIARL